MYLLPKKNKDKINLYLYLFDRLTVDNLSANLSLAHMIDTIDGFAVIVCLCVCLWNSRLYVCVFGEHSKLFLIIEIYN